MTDKLKNLTTAHAALGYAINKGAGISEASIALDDAICAYYGEIPNEFDAHSNERCRTQWNVSDIKENGLVKLNYSAIMSEWKLIKDAPVDTSLIVVWNGVVQNILFTVDSDGLWWTAEEELCVSDLKEDAFTKISFNPSHFMELPKFKVLS